jgi:hypothetical protein
MTTGQPGQPLPSEVDDRLNRLLECWADRHRLTPARAEAILQTILETSGELGYDWWQAFWGRMNDIIIRAHSVPSTVVTGLQMVQQFIPSWPNTRNVAGYRPYLRLV